MYAPNRCILCTRCVRFMDDVAHDPVLNVSERGDRAVIGKFEGQDLTHAWAGNVIDLCPVGALLSKDSLNKARAWELDRTASVCPNCSQGCNMIVETRDNMVVRLRPRPNDDVNKYFMCDHGRLNYRWMNRQDRVDVPMVRQRRHARRRRLADRRSPRRRAMLAGKRAFVLASPMLSNEALFLLVRAREERRGGAGAYRVEQGAEAPLPGVEDLALRADRAANVRGAELLGFTRSDAPLVRPRRRRRAVVADEELAGVDAADVGEGRRDHRHRHDAARVGAARRGRRAADRELRRGRGHVHEPPRPRAALHAGEGGARVSRGRAGSCCPICSRRSACAPNYSLASDVFARARGGAAGVRRNELRHARPARASPSPAPRDARERAS